MIDPYLVGGFFFAGVVGFMANFVLDRWFNITDAWTKIFKKPPQPFFLRWKGVTARAWATGTVPDVSALRMIINGVTRIVLQAILLFAVTGVIFGLFVSLPRNAVQAGFLEGVFWAGYVAVVISEIRLNINETRQAYKRIVDPPAPWYDNERSPNSKVAAANPRKPPFWVVVENVFEIAWRSTWIFILAVLLFVGPVIGHRFFLEGAAPPPDRFGT
jgi:hypothetical protein